MGEALFELPAVTTPGRLALLSSGASDFTCVLSVATALIIVGFAKMPSSRNDGFQVSTK